MRTIVIDHMNVPSCGKFEVEWALRKIMGDPGIPLTTLSGEVEAYFREDVQTADRYVHAARKAYDQLKFRDAIHVMECTECNGKGGFMDTTIDRTGEWAWCHKCDGYGHTFSMPALMRLAGVPRVKVPR